MTILGLGGLLDDPACAVLSGGELRAAVEEEKLMRSAKLGAVPEGAIAECLKAAGARRADVDCVAVVRPFARGPESHFHVNLRREFPNAEIVLVEHHQAHAASAFFASPYDEATVLTLDHSGDFRCGARWSASGNQIQIEKEWYFPDSLGRLYGAVTELLGFDSGADEHKVQWLSASGDDRYVDLFREILVHSPRIEAAYLDREFEQRFFDRLGVDASNIAGVAGHVARGLQAAVEEAVINLAGEGENLCLAGGLFFNAMLVEALERCGRWENVFVQAAAGNAGTALGAVWHVWHQLRREKRKHHSQSLLLGPSYSAEEIKQVLENCKLPFRYQRSNDEMLAAAVRMLGENKIVAWMQGRMEFGPRALGNRSLLASPLDPYSSENLNVYIKRREAFRKFAASVPAEVASTYFETGHNANNLATVGRVREAHRGTFAAATLGRDRIRVHTVEEHENPLFHRLLREAGKATGLPVLYNTSFNLFGDPLVSTPRDAVRSFYSSGVDAMFVGNFLLEK